MTKWLMALGCFSFWMLLHWVAGNDFERGEKTAVTLTLAVIFALGGWVLGKIWEMDND